MHTEHINTLPGHNVLPPPVKLGGLNQAFWSYWDTQCSGRGQTLRAVAEHTYMLLKPETLATPNRGRKLDTPLKIGNNVYGLFAACPTSRIPLPFTSKARFRPHHYKIPEITS